MNPSSSSALKVLFSYELFFVLLACLLAGGALLLRAMDMEVLRAMELLPVKVFFIAIAVNRVGGVIHDGIFNRDRLLLSVGVIMVIAGAGVNSTMWYRGTAGLGSGEPLEGFEQVSHGIFAGQYGGGDIIINSISGDVLMRPEDSEVEIFGKGGARYFLHSGDSQWLGYIYRVRVESVEAAPLFQVRSPGGAEVFSSFVKLRLHPVGERDYFMVNPLPHRFYLSLTGKVDKPLRLVVTRGRLVLIDQGVALGEVVSVDDIEVRIPSVAGWASLTVEKQPGLIAMLAGFLMVLAGSAIVLWRRHG